MKNRVIYLENSKGNKLKVIIDPVGVILEPLYIPEAYELKKVS